MSSPKLLGPKNQRTVHEFVSDVFGPTNTSNMSSVSENWKDPNPTHVMPVSPAAKLVASATTEIGELVPTAPARVPEATSWRTKVLDASADAVRTDAVTVCSSFT
jgi:hypothetical protein